LRNASGGGILFSGKKKRTRRQKIIATYSLSVKGSLSKKEKGER
jgi:hypothetical protein